MLVPILNLLENIFKNPNTCAQNYLLLITNYLYIENIYPFSHVKTVKWKTEVSDISCTRSERY